MHRAALAETMEHGAIRGLDQLVAYLSRQIEAVGTNAVAGELRLQIDTGILFLECQFRVARKTKP